MSERIYEKQVVIFEEKDCIQVPAKEVRYVVPEYKADIISVKEVTFPVRLEVRKGHSFLQITDMKHSLYLPSSNITLDQKKDGDIYTEIVTTDEALSALGKVRYIMYEQGGGYTNTGDARIYCTTTGEPMKPLFVITRGHRACGRHAAFALWEGQKLVQVLVDRWRGDYYIKVSELTADKVCIMEQTLWEARDLNNPVDEIPEKVISRYQKAIEAAVKKSRCYHCREPHYIIK